MIGEAQTNSEGGQESLPLDYRIIMFVLSRLQL